MGDDTPIAWLTPEDRYVEKLATPDVTVADLVGDVDPIKAARSGQELGSELTMHYGLLPRANRGIFAINEIPDLAGKIQVALFNIMQEGDVQIKGYPVRLPLDVAIVFSANPEDYTARGKIVTPLKDRIGSEIRTHYPESIDEAIAITEQEAWTARSYAPDNDTIQTIEIPHYIRQIVEQIAFSAREDKKVDKRSGVSQRLPISTMELVVSNAERRALIHGESIVVPRVGDIYAALPGITGKIELEYEGEMRGADTVIREIIRPVRRQRLRQLLRRHQHPADRAVVQPRRHRPAQRRPALRRLARRAQADPGPLRKTLAATDQRQDPSPRSPSPPPSSSSKACTPTSASRRSEERSFSAAEKKSRNDQAAQYAERMRERETGRLLRPQPHPPRLQLAPSDTQPGASVSKRQERT